MTFPPLVPANKNKSANREPFITFMSDEPVQRKPEPIEDPKPTATNAPVKQPEEDSKAKLSEEPVKANRKPKFDFLNNKESVIFCDEMGKKKSRVTSAARSESKEALSASNALNGIKFGSLDSSSASDEGNEEEEGPEEQGTTPALPNTKIKTNPPRSLKKHKNTPLRTTTSASTTASHSSTKPSSSLCIKTFATSSTTTTSSTDNEEINPNTNSNNPKHQRVASSRKAKPKSSSQVRNLSKANQRLKSDSIKTSSNALSPATTSKAVDDSLSHDSSIIKNGPPISGANSNQAQAYPVPVAPVNLPPHLAAQYPPQGPPPPPYFFYNASHQINNAYMAAYYSSVNSPNGAGGSVGQYGYSGVPNQFPPGVLPPHSFYPGKYRRIH